MAQAQNQTRTQEVTIDRNGDGFLVTYSTQGSNGQWHRGRGDRFDSIVEVIACVNRHTRSMEQMGYRVQVTDNSV